MSRPVRRICVFCGSRPGNRPEYVVAARRLGALLAERGIGLVYGGASVGVMGAIANAALKAGGEVIGVIPEALVSREVAHDHLTELHVVKNMHERKAMMDELTDAVIALPGGLGTFEELFEAMTWAQLGIHTKAIGLLNVHGFYGGLLTLVDHAIEQGFALPEHRGLFVAASEPDALLDLILAFEPPPPVRKWLKPDDI